MPHTQQESLVIVGNGPVGYSLCRELVASGPHHSFSVTIFGEEPRPAYDRVHLTELFSGRTPADLEFASREWYADHQIDLQTGDPVEWIDRDAQQVGTRSGRETHYDRLVLATGSSPFLPPVPGVDLPSVFVYRTLEDLTAIRQVAERQSTAVVLGGGLLGLEAARALTDLGLKTTILERAPALMPRQLDEAGASLLKAKIESQGVEVLLPRQLLEITQRENGFTLQLQGHSARNCDLLVIAAGIRPRDDLARECGLEIGERGGIVINDRLETSDPRIHAIGECALHRGVIYGLAAPGYLMAEILAENLSGSNREFIGCDFSAQLKLMGIDVSSIGQFLATGDDVTSIASRQQECYRKLILQNHRLIGVISVGPNKELSRLQEAISEKRRISEKQKRRFQNTGQLWPGENLPVRYWPAQAVVCSCMRVTRQQLTEACHAGATTVEELAAETKASTVCGSCEGLLAELVGESQKPKRSVAQLTLGMVACLSIMAVGLIFWWQPPAVVNSVRETNGVLTRLIRDDFWKQVTGFGMLGASLLTLTLSLRKRFPWLNRGAYSHWRVAHSALGFLILCGLFLHTGGSLGQNLNAMLMISFLMLNLLGGVAAILTAVESNVSGQTAILTRRWRPRLTRLHIYLFWPFPVLIAFHIFSFYYFG